MADGEVVIEIKGDTAELQKGVSRAEDVIHNLDTVTKSLSTSLNGVKKDTAGAFNPLQEEAEKAGEELGGLQGELEKAREELDKLREEADKLKETEKASQKFESLGNAAKAMGKAVAAAAVTAGAAAFALGKAVVSAYGEYEQLVGGVETLFGTGGMGLDEYAESIGKTADEAEEEYNRLMAAQETVLSNADNAFKTAGLSANEYMDTVTSFSASLISSLGGDTAKAASYADMAITDMSDNANKMGTDMESIQNAYQGFAKQNYTMLDNLKLGYGGTQAEMQRLLEDAQAISGVNYDLSSFADIVSAIHVIQENMGIAGTTAKEAEGTITGSVSSMTAAFDNLLAGLGNSGANIEKLCNDLSESFATVIGNITPVIENIVAALPTAVNALLEAVVELLPTLLQAATNLFEKMLNTIVELLPTLTPVAVEMVLTLANAIVDNLPLLADAAIYLVEELASGIADTLPELIPTAVQAVLTIADGLVNHIDLLTDAAIQLIVGLVQGLVNSIPLLISAAPVLIANLTTELLKFVWKMGELGGELCDAIADALVHYDWSDCAESVMTSLCDALDKAQKHVQVWLDNIFTNGEVYGGDVNNVDSTGFIENMRDGIDITAGAIKEAQEGLQEAYDEGVGKTLEAEEDKRDEIVETTEELNSALESSLASLSSSNSTIIAEETEETAAAVDEISDAFKEAYDNLSAQLDFGIITEAEFYEQLQQLLDDYNAFGVNAYSSYYAKLLKYQQSADKAQLKELTSTQKEAVKTLQSSLSSLVKTYQSKYDEIAKSQESYASKLKLGLDIFQKDETDDAIIYSISNIKEYRKQVEQFANAVQKLKDRGLNSDLLSEIMDMGVDDGTIYAQNILAMGEEEFNDLNATYDELTALIDDKSKELYSGELEEVNNNFVTDVKALFGSLPEEIQGIGLEAAAGFVDGLNLSSDDVIESTNEFFSDVFDSLTDSIDSASSAVTTVDNYMDALVEELEERTPEFYDAISKLFEDSGVAIKVKSAVEYESAALPSAISGGGGTTAAVNDTVQGSGGKSLVEALNKPIYITLDGKTIAEYVIDYINSVSRRTGGSTIK